MDIDPSDLKVEFNLVVSTMVTQQKEGQSEWVSDRVDLRDPPDPKIKL